MADFTFLLITYSLFFICSIVFSLLINGLFLKFVRTLGIRNPNDGTIIRWGSQSKPALGGISFYIVFLLSIAGYAILVNADHISYNRQFLGVLMATTVGFLIGLADDAYNTNPLLKFLAQLLCGLILIVSGTYIHISSNIVIDYLVTVFWVIGIMNSINMLDNMDAITSVISISIILSGISVLVLTGNITNVNSIILVGVLASLIGFLFFNWHPSKIYMGDTGSQFLGVFLAAIGIEYFWTDTFNPNVDVITLKKIIVPVMIFIMPIIDTTIVVIARIKRGQSPFVGGKDHTTHRLAYLGCSDRQVAIIFFAISLISSALVIFVCYYVRYWTIATAGILLVYFLAVLSVFLYISRITNHFIVTQSKKV